MSKWFVEHARQLLAEVSVGDMYFRVGRQEHFAEASDIWLQVCAVRYDNDAIGEIGERRGRKWRLSIHMTDSEIIRTAFAACMAFEEHELREKFTYKGIRIFGPHIDVEDLVEVAKREEDRRSEGNGAVD